MSKIGLEKQKAAPKAAFLFCLIFIKIVGAE